MPDFNVIKIGCIVVILLVLLIAAVIITVKREKSKRKIRRMCAYHDAGIQYIF